MTEHELTVTVNAGTDPRRHERAARELCQALEEDPALVRAGLVVRRAPMPPAPDGAKGSAEVLGMSGTLLVVGRWYVPHVAEVLKSAIEQWCARDRRMSVTARDGERSLTFTGDPNEEQRALIDRFFARDDAAGPDDLADS